MLTEQLFDRISNAVSCSENLRSLADAESQEVARFRLAQYISSDEAFHRHTERYAETLDLHKEGTSAWLWKSPQFTDWLQGKSPRLLCTGVYGAGKTVLAAAILHHLLDTHHSNEVGISYLFCKYGSEVKNSVRELKSVLLRQLIGQVSQVPDLVKKRFDGSREQAPLPMKTIDTLLGLVCRSFQDVFVIVDGIDESDEEVAIALLDLITTLRTASLKGAHILVTAYDTKEVETLAGLSLPVQADTHDVFVFLGDLLSKLPPHLAADIVQTVIANSDGM